MKSMNGFKLPLIAAVAAAGMWSTAAIAIDTDVSTTVTVAAPTPTIAGTAPVFATSVIAVSKTTGTPASAVLAPAGTVTFNTGTSGGPRLIPVVPGTPAALAYTVTGGVNDAVMSLRVGNTTGGATVTLTGAVGDATFTISTWTATASVGTISTPLNATTGVGGVTLSNAGALTLAIGGTLRTDNSGNNYGNGTYTGDIRVALNY